MRAISSLFSFRFIGRFYIRSINIFRPSGLVPSTILLMRFRRRRLVIEGNRFQRNMRHTRNHFPNGLCRLIMTTCHVRRHFLGDHTLKRFLVSCLGLSRINVRERIKAILYLHICVRRSVVNMGPLSWRLCTRALTARITCFPIVILMSTLRCRFRRRQTFVAWFPRVSIRTNV